MTDSQKKMHMLEAAAQIASTLGWDDITIALVAKNAGKSRQWVHRVFGSNDQLKIELMGYLFDDWYEQNLKLMSKRLPMNVSIEKSFMSLVDASPHMLVAIRKLFGETADCTQEIYARGRAAIEELWIPLWCESEGLNKEQAIAATAILFWGSIELAGLVQSGAVNQAKANATLVAMAEGVINAHPSASRSKR